MIWSNQLGDRGGDLDRGRQSVRVRSAQVADSRGLLEAADLFLRRHAGLQLLIEAFAFQSTVFTGAHDHRGNSPGSLWAWPPVTVHVGCRAEGGSGSACRFGTLRGIHRFRVVKV